MRRQLRLRGNQLDDHPFSLSSTSNLHISFVPHVNALLAVDVLIQDICADKVKFTLTMKTLAQTYENIIIQVNFIYSSITL